MLHTVTIPFPQLMSNPTSPASSRHPNWMNKWNDWLKWRLTYEGGPHFVERYMKKLSTREDDTDFLYRKEMAYVPEFATAAIVDIKNSIFQRTADVERAGGANSYQKVISGVNGGVDLEGSSMGTFIGTQIIEEMLVMEKVGVLVDNYRDLGSTQADLGDKRPFLTMYQAENILSWSPNHPSNGYDAVLLYETFEETNEFGLPTSFVPRYRLMVQSPSGVLVYFYDKDGKLVDTVLLSGVERIPFVVFEVSRSLMRAAADYQIALMNLESSDLSFARNANFPIYYEYYDWRTEKPYQKPPSTPQQEGEDTSKEAKTRETRIGSVLGRRIPRDLSAPGFASPDPEILRVSMEKGKQLKDDIRAIVNLNLIALNPRRQSAESKDADNKSLESSLSYIGMVLQRGEQQLAEYWRMFDRTGKKPKITYPKSYSLKTEEDRRLEAGELDKLSDKVPSETYRREVKKKIAKTLMGADLTEREMKQILTEIDTSDVLTSDANIVLSAHKAGLVGDVTASTALGFEGETEVTKAQEDRARRIALTLEAQGGEGGAARGAPEFDKGQKESDEEKEGKAQRGQNDASNMGSEQK